MRSVIVTDGARPLLEKFEDFIERQSFYFLESAGVPGLALPECVVSGITNRAANNSDTARSVKAITVHLHSLSDAQILKPSWAQLGRKTEPGGTKIGVCQGSKGSRISMI